MTDQTYTIFYETDPFSGAVASRDVPVGDALAAAMACVEGAETRVELFIGGRRVPPVAWGWTKPKAGVEVEARAVPADPGTMIAIAAIAAGSATTAAIGTGIVASIISIGVTYAVQIGLSALFLPSAKSYESQNSDAESYSVSGASNTISQWTAVPVVHGRHRYTPPYGAAPYTEVRGANQYMRLVVVWGYGPVELEDLRIGTTSIEDFDGVTIEHDLDGTGDLGLFPSVVHQSDLSVDLNNTYKLRTTEPDTDEIGITVTFPSGLYDVTKGGNVFEQGVRFRAQYRPTSGGSWTTFIDETVTAESRSAYRHAWNVDVPRGEYDVRLRRYQTGADDRAVEDAVWTALRSITDEDPVQVDGIAKTAIRIKATSQLNGVVDEINAIVSRKIPVWDGTDWDTIEATTNPAAIYRDMLRGAANKRATERTDDESLGDWFEYCTDNALNYSAVWEGQRSLSEGLDEVAAAGHASRQIEGGLWTVVVDRPKETVVQRFTPRNSWGFTGDVPMAELPHALRVQFNNADEDWEQDELIIYDTGYDATTATRFEVVNAAGATTSAEAQVFGRLALASGRLRPETFTFNVDFEAMKCQRGDLIEITHDVALIGQASGRVKSVSGENITLDEYVTFEGGNSYGIKFRTATSGSLSYDVSGADSVKSVTVPGLSGVAAGDLFVFGERGQESVQATVKAIRPASDLEAEIEAIPYAEGVYETGAIGEYETSISSPVSLSQTGPAMPQILSVVSDERALDGDAQGIIQPAILLSLSPGFTQPGNSRATTTKYYRIGWRLAGSSEESEFITIPVESATARISGVKSGAAYSIDVQALDVYGQVSAINTIGSHTVIGLVAPPPSVDTFRITTQGQSAYLEWTYPSIVSDVVAYEVRWHQGQGVSDWKKMPVLSDEVPRTARSLMAPSQSGSYGIKAIDADGNKSAAATFVSSGLSDPSETNAIWSLDPGPAFSGDLSGASILADRVVLSSLTTIADWDSLSSISTMDEDINGAGFVDVGSYQPSGALDLGAVYTSQVSYEIDVEVASLRGSMATWVTLSGLADMTGGATGDEFSVELQASYSRDDVASGSASFTEWSRIVADEITARHIRFRLVLATDDDQVSPAISGLRIAVDMPDRILTGQDQTSTAVSFSPAFRGLKSITVAGQDMATGDYYEITGKSATGATVTFYNAAGMAVSRSFDWQAIGYGREAA